MNCENCKKLMSHRGANYYDCFNCGWHCEKHGGGQIMWFDREGNRIILPVENSTKVIMQIEEELAEGKNKKRGG